MDNISNRKISVGPTREEVRLHALDMAVRSSQLMGRADNVMQLAEQYFEWISKPGMAPESDSATAEPRQGDRVPGAGPSSTFEELMPLAAPGKERSSDMPASVRQAGASKSAA